MEINGYWVIIQYDPEIEMFRGEFIDLNGGAGLYVTGIEGLRQEDATEDDIFLFLASSLADYLQTTIVV